MATHTIPPNEELIFTRLFRDRLAATEWASALISNRLTQRPNGDEIAPAHDFAVIVRGDGGQSLEPPTYLRRLGIRVFGPDGDDNTIRTSELARYVAVLLRAAWQHSTHIARTRAVNGPYRVRPTVGRPEMYLTADVVVTGDAINL